MAIECPRVLEPISSIFLINPRKYEAPVVLLFIISKPIEIIRIAIVFVLDHT